MEQNELVARFRNIVSEHGEFDDSIHAYVALLYLEKERQKLFAGEASDFYKGAETIVKSYFGRFGTNKHVDVLNNVAALNLTEKDFRSLLSYLLSGAMGHFEESSSSFEMTQLVSGLLEVGANETVLDFGSGNGSMLCGIENYLWNKSIPASYIGVEPNASLAATSKYALATIGCVHDIQVVDGFSKATPAYNKGFVFPPCGLKQSKAVLASLVEGDLFNARSSFEWAFVFKALEGLRNNGKLIAMLPEGCLFKKADAKIRKRLLDAGLIEGIVSFPAKSLIGTFRKYNLVILSRGNESLKLVDGADLFKTLEIRTFNEMAVEAIRYSYLEGNAKVIPYAEINKGDYSMAIGSLHVNETYQSLTELVPFETVYDFEKGTPKTIANFKESISNAPTNWRILTSGNIVDGEIDYDSMQYVYFDPSLERYEAKEGDIIITTKSSKVKIAIVEKHGPYRIVVTGAMLILRPHGPANQLYTKLFLESEKGQRIIASAQKGTVITALSPTILAKAMIPFPPIEAQKAFVADYEKKREEAKKARQALKAIEQELENYFDKKTKAGE